jgi:hypothetical protein
MQPSFYRSSGSRPRLFEAHHPGPCRGSREAGAANTLTGSVVRTLPP